MSSTWFRIALTQQQINAGHLNRIGDAAAALLIKAGSPRNAAVFGLSREDGEDLFFTPSAANLTVTLLHENGGVPSEPPVDDGTATLLVGHSVDVRLLSS